MARADDQEASSVATRPMPDDELAVTEARAAKMVGFSVRRLRGWASRSIVGPGVERRLSERNTVRLYRFQDLVELHVAKELLDHGRSPQQIRKVVHHLRSRDYEAPLRQLVFAVQGDRIYFQHPDGTWEGDRAPDQIVLHSVLDLEGIRALVRRAVAPDRQRRAGKLVQRRGVVGGKPVFEGTRIPVTAIEPYLRRGLPDERILEAFPLLTEADIEAARRMLASA
jgi:uncharacterized protein (DUF433 family)